MRGLHPIEHQLDRFDVAGLEKPDHPVGIADGRHFGRGDHQRLTRGGGRILEPLLDAGGTVDEHVIELLGQQSHDLLHVVGREPLEHARIAGRQKGEVGFLLVLHQGLLQAATAGEHLLGGVDDPVLKPQQQIKVAQAEIGIEHGGSGPLLGQGDAQIGRERGFADATFA